MEENKTFEDYLTELEGVLKALENREISLEDAVKGYTRGLELSKKCYEILNNNEQLVVTKMTEAGLEPFNTQGNN
ncbi:MAG: exodeoxyribonuclease VII small subunit [Acholeplasmatales bacterium]|nr:exodeoxyribonuclease VII small subunit [Acholeplasmatales bacterium]